MPMYKVQREYTSWEELTIEAESKEEAEERANDEEVWAYAVDVSTYEYTGEIWVGEADE